MPIQTQHSFGECGRCGAVTFHRDTVCIQCARPICSDCTPTGQDDYTCDSCQSDNAYDAGFETCRMQTLELLKTIGEESMKVRPNRSVEGILQEAAGMIGGMAPGNTVECST